MPSISSQNLTHGELFAGISGFGLGFAQAGIKTLWHVEIDKHCQSVLRRHYPDDLILSDIRDCGKHNLLKVNIVSFGSPCQGLSVAGQRKGLDDDRSILFFEAIRVVDELEPDFAIWENVPGALSSNSGRDFATVLAEFRRIGARDIAWRIIDSQYHGVAQRRRRVFLIADFRGERAAEILFEPESGPWDTPPSREARQRITNGSQKGIGIGSGEGLETREERPSGIRGVGLNGGELGFALRANPSHSGDKGDGGVNTNMVIKETARTQAFAQTIDHYDPSQQTYILESDVDTSLSSKGDRLDGESDTFVIQHAVIDRKPEAGPQAKGWRNDGATWTLDGRGQSDIIVFGTKDSHTSRNIVRKDSLPVLTTTKNEGVFNPGFDVRRLTPLECERLQGFPDGWTDEQSDTQRYRQLGNAITVNVARWLGHRIIKVCL